MRERADLTYYQRNQDVILKRLREQARHKHINLSEEKK